MRIAAVSLAVIFIAVGTASAGPQWGPPGWQNAPLDPSSPGVPRLPAHFWMEGAWGGTGSQSGGSSWSIRLTVQKQGVTNYYYKIEYPSLDCGGYWTFNAGNGDTGSFTEHIVYGRDKCIDGGAITVGAVASSSGSINRMAFRWEGSQPSGQRDSAQGTLTRN